MCKPWSERNESRKGLWQTTQKCVHLFQKPLHKTRCKTANQRKEARFSLSLPDRYISLSLLKPKVDKGVEQLGLLHTLVALKEICRETTDWTVQLHWTNRPKLCGA